MDKHFLLNMKSLLTVGFCMLVISCAPKAKEETGGGLAPVPVGPIEAQGLRKIGLHVTQAQGESYQQAIDLIKSVKVNHVNIHLIWGDGGQTGLPIAPLASNSSGTTFDFTLVDIINNYYPSQNLPVMLSLGTIDTNNKFVPSQYKSVAFDNTNMINAFKNLLTNLMPRLSSVDLVSIQVGNEVDVLLGTDAVAWSQYKIFFDAMVTHLHSLRPGIKVGVTTTLYGALDPAKQNYIKALNQNADFISTTYYPMDSGFVFKAPDFAVSDLEQFAAAFKEKSIYFQEVGYSSGSTAIGSSLDKQKLFVEKFFQFWDQHKEQIPVVSWLNLTEWPQSSVDGFGAQYGLCPSSLCAPFKEYLKTLGLRDEVTGQAKPAWNGLVEQLQIRQWN